MKIQNLLFGVITILLFSCTEDNVIVNPNNYEKCNLFINSDGSSTTVTEVDIHTLVNKLSNAQTKSRASDYTISAVYDSEGNPAIYVINYANENGFLLLSATKTHSPILAYSDKGHFIGDPFSKTGLAFWQNNMVSKIKNSKVLPADSIAKAKKQWDYYTNLSSIKQIKSRSDISFEEYQQLSMIVQDSCASWSANGYTIYDVYGQFFEDELACETMRQELQNAIYPAYLDYWEDLCMIVERVGGESYLKPNLLMTTWDGATDEFRQAFPLLENGSHAFVGCGPIAAGQIMRDYCWPTTYSWNDMPLQYGTLQTSQFLYDVATFANAAYFEDGTSTNLDGIYNAFIAMDYTAQTNTHINWNTVKNNIKNNKPVFMAGNTTDRGHAWVVCGYSMTHNVSTTEVYCFLTPNDFSCYHVVENYDVINEKYYCNWGIAGSNDGFYDLNIYNSQIPTYTNLRTIVNITPNNN